jgi:hypothetical protein
MGLLGWVEQNWFDLLSAAGIVGGLWFTAIGLHSEAKTRRIANLITLTENHRELMAVFYQNLEPSRILDPSANVTGSPVSRGEEVYINALIQHLSSVYRAMQSDVTVKPEGLRLDVNEFFRLPIPRFVWNKNRPYQDKEFVAFVESCLNEPE